MEQDFYSDKEKVLDYIEMCSDYKPEIVCNELDNYLSPGAHILELGSGPGIDAEYMKNKYAVTCSDFSAVFVEHLKEKYSETIRIDARDFNLNESYDCIFSNKVLHHLTTDELKQSLSVQKNHLKNNGIVFHTFWRGDKTEFHYGMRFVHYTPEDISEIVETDFDLLHCDLYTEMHKNDSILIVAKDR